MIPSLARLAGEGYLRRIEELESISTRGMNENEEIREYYQRRKAWGDIPSPLPPYGQELYHGRRTRRSEFRYFVVSLRDLTPTSHEQTACY